MNIRQRLTWVEDMVQRRRARRCTAAVVIRWSDVRGQPASCTVNAEGSLDIVLSFAGLSVDEEVFPQGTRPALVAEQQTKEGAEDDSK